ncbi:hypothetical protein PSTT_00014, partial [Puccinia striiformis]
TKPEKVADSDVPNPVNRDQSIDVLRGLNCLAIVLVNTAGPVRSNWLSHASSVHQAITFADTLFPCFVFTSVLAITRTKKIKHKDRASRLIKRALYLQDSIGAWDDQNLNLISRSSLQFYRLSPVYLGTWSLDSVHLSRSIQALKPGWTSKYTAHPTYMNWYMGLGFLGSLLTGLLPSPAFKLLWTPTWVGQTIATSLLYWSMLKALASCPNRVTCAINSALGMLGQRSLEVYLISAGVALGLEGIGIWDVIYQLINNLLIPIGFHDDHQYSLSKRTSAHQRKHDPAAYNYSPSFQAVPQTFDFANPFELHASEWAAAITSTSHSGSGTKSDGSSIAYLLMPSSSKNPLLSSIPSSTHYE